MNVRKSDGSLEEFDGNKIRNGVCDAYTSIGEKCPDELIDSLIKNLYLCENMQTSEIRRQVEECLMSLNKKVAKNYISKFERDKTLINRNDFIKNYINASNASTGSKFDSNANVANKNIATLNAEIPKQKNIQFNRYNTSNKIAKLFSKKLAKQYIEDLESHIIYKNDESSFGINSPYTYSCKEVVEVMYKNRHLLVPFDLLYNLIDEDEVLVNERDGAWQKYPENLMVKDFDGSFIKVSAVTKKARKRDLYRVKTAFGEDIVVTDNHPMIVDKDNIEATVEASHSENMPQFKANDKLTFDGKTKIDMTQCLDTKEATDVYCVNYSNEICSRYLPLNYEVGYLIGFFAANGRYDISDSNSYICFSHLSREILEKVNNILFKYLGIYGVIQKEESEIAWINLKISNSYLWWLFLDYFKIQDGGEDRSLPYNVLETNEEFAKGLLYGLLDEMGFGHDCDLKLSMGSRSIILQTTALLRHFNYSVNNTYDSEYSTWGVECSIKEDSIPLGDFYRLARVRISEESLKYKKDGQTTITSVTKITDNEPFLNLNSYIYDITTDTHTFVSNNLLVHNCCALQSYPFLVDGLKGIGGLSSAPKNIDSFCGMFVNWVFASASMFAGACLHKNQKLIIKTNDRVESITAKDLINRYNLQKTFSNYQGDWSYEDISDKEVFVAEDGRFVRVNKVFKRNYNDKIYKVKTYSGLECAVSKDHRFKVLFQGRNIEVKAEDLQLFDMVFVAQPIKNGDCEDETKALCYDRIELIETFDNDDEFVYEIETESHWYNCGGMITHNCAFAGFFNMFNYYACKEWGDDYFEHDDRVTRVKYEKGKEVPISISKQIEQYFQQIV